jgi:hypothetical protein
MKKKDFDLAIINLKKGDHVLICGRGNYGNYENAGILEKIEDGRVCFERGWSLAWQRIISITKLEEVKK